MKKKWKMLGIIYNDHEWSIFYRYHEGKYSVLCVAGLKGVKIVNPDDVSVVLFSASFKEIKVGRKNRIRFVPNPINKTSIGLKYIQIRKNGIAMNKIWFNANPYHCDTAGSIFCFLTDNSDVSDIILQGGECYYDPDNKNTNKKRDIKEWLKRSFFLDIDKFPGLSDFISDNVPINYYAISERDVIPDTILKRHIPGFLKKLANSPHCYLRFPTIHFGSNAVKCVRSVFEEIKDDFKSLDEKYYKGIIFQLYGRVFYFGCQTDKWYYLAEI